MRQPLALRAAQALRRAAGVDARTKQALVSVDISDADDSAPVHEELLDGGSMSACESIQRLGLQLARKRLEAEVSKKRMLGGVLRPQYRAEAAWVAQAQDAIAQQQVE